MNSLTNQDSVHMQTYLLYGDLVNHVFLCMQITVNRHDTCKVTIVPAGHAEVPSRYFEVLSCVCFLHRKHLSKLQLSSLMRTELQFIFSTLELFVTWVSNGVYDFCELPFSMKADLPSEVVEELKRVSSQYLGILLYTICWYELTCYDALIPQNMLQMDNLFEVCAVFS